MCLARADDGRRGRLGRRAEVGGDHRLEAVDAAAIGNVGRKQAIVAVDELPAVGLVQAVAPVPASERTSDVPVLAPRQADLSRVPEVRSVANAP